MNPTPQFNSFSFGYVLNQPREAVQAAFEAAEHVIQDLKREGSTTRAWGLDTHSKIEDFLASATEDLKCLHHPALALKNSLMKTILEFEDDIQESIKRYFRSVSESLLRMKKLNPPLTTQGLEPFFRTINDDRMETVAALDSLRHDLTKLQDLKSRIVVASFH